MDIWCGNMMGEKEQNYVGCWDIPNLVETGIAQHIYGPPKLGEVPPRHVCFQFPTTSCCRMVRLKLMLPFPRLQGKSFSLPTTMVGMPSIHLKKIIIVGKQHFVDDMLMPSFLHSEKSALRTFLETPPHLNRSEVRIIAYSFHHVQQHSFQKKVEKFRNHDIFCQQYYNLFSKYNDFKFFPS